MNTNQNPVDSVNTDEKMVALHTVTIQQFADELGIEYLQASALMAFLVNTNVAVEAGKAEKAPGARGKAATLYNVPAEAIVVFFPEIPGEIPVAEVKAEVAEVAEVKKEMEIGIPEATPEATPEVAQVAA